MGFSQKRTAAHSTAHSMDVTHASRVASAPLARIVGEKHQSAWVAAAATSPERRAALHSSNPPITVTMIVALRAAKRFCRRRPGRPDHSMWTAARYHSGGVRSMAGSTARRAAAKPHLGSTGAPELNE